jgi:hypothetical protein
VFVGARFAQGRHAGKSEGATGLALLQIVHEPRTSRLVQQARPILHPHSVLSTVPFRANSIRYERVKIMEEGYQYQHGMMGTATKGIPNKRPQIANPPQKGQSRGSREARHLYGGWLSPGQAHSCRCRDPEAVFVSTTTTTTPHRADASEGMDTRTRTGPPHHRDVF